MKTDILKNLAKDLFGENIGFTKQIRDGKWYEREYSTDFKEIENGLTYGVIIDGSITFDFKASKSPDNIIKTFINQFISKYEAKKFDFETMQPIGLKKAKSKFINSDRVFKSYFYTTLYGIGYFCYFMNQEVHNKTKKLLSDYLKSKKIDFTNEFSEAGWVYRFLINKGVSTHNYLLSEFKI